MILNLNNHCPRLAEKQQSHVRQADEARLEIDDCVEVGCRSISRGPRPVAQATGASAFTPNATTPSATSPGTGPVPRVGGVRDHSALLQRDVGSARDYVADGVVT
jgi:hypothetical protein